MSDTDIVVALIGYPGMPGPERVRHFLNVKGLGLQLEDPQSFFGEHINLDALMAEVAAGQPLIELADGTHLIGVSPIQMFVEEVHPEPNLLGRTALERASVEMWQRSIENRVLSSLGVYAYHSYLGADSDDDADAACRNAHWGQRNVEDLMKMLAELDTRLGAVEMVAGAQYSAADIALLTSLDFAESLEIHVSPRFANIARWRRSAAQLSHCEGTNRFTTEAGAPSPVSPPATPPRFVSEDLSGSEKRIAVVGLDGCYQFGNQHLLDVHGLTATELKELHLSDIVGQEFYDTVTRRSMQQCVRTGETIRRRALVPYKQVEQRYIDIEYAPWINDLGEIEAVVLTIEDVHRYRFLADRPQVEPSAERVQLLDAVYGSIRDRVVVLDEQGHWIYANQPTLDFYGVSLPRIIGHHLSEWVGSRYFDTVIRPVIAAGFRGENSRVESGYYSPAGEWIDVVFDYSAYNERNGVVSGVVMQTHQACDAQKIVENQTRPLDLHRLRFVSSILGSAASDRISVLDTDCRYLLVNAAVQERWGLSTSDFMGRHIREIVGDDFFNMALAESFNTCLRGQYVNVQMSAKRKDGVSRLLQMELFPYSDQPGQTAIQAVMMKVNNIEADPTVRRIPDVRHELFDDAQSK